MTWSYSNNPASSSRDEVRFLVGDTDDKSQLLQNEEIDYCITTAGTGRLGAALAAEAIAAKFSRLADRSVGQVSVSCSQKAEAYRKLATDLRHSAGALALPRFGEVFKAENDRLTNDTALVQPSFKVGMNDPPGTNERDTSHDPEFLE